MDEVNLDSQTVSRLKEQVESRLSKKNSKTPLPPKSGKSQKSKTASSTGSKKQTFDTNTVDQAVPKPNPSAGGQSMKSKSHSGAVKFPSNDKFSRSNDDDSRPSQSAIATSSRLRDEVLALGGDEEDLRLLEDVESDSELEVFKVSMYDTDLPGDLSKFMKNMPFEQFKEDVYQDYAEDEQSSTAGDDAASSVGARKSLPDELLVAPQSEWFKIHVPSLPTSESRRLSEKAVQELLQCGQELLKKENQIYADSNKSNSSYKFYKEMMVSGTLTDKISALTLSVQESPIHNQQPLETLVAMAKKRSRSQAVQVLGALKDLFGAGSLLPSDRRLRHFASQPGLTQLPLEVFKNWNHKQTLPQPLLKEHLILWTFEDWLKSTYFDIIKILETWSNDEIKYSRLRSVDYVSDLLKAKPEQEANLLNLLVNKLGDPEKQVASRASSHLVQLQIPHPFMKSVIISHIEAKILFKPGETWHAKYYAVITLNQTVLNSGQEDVVQKLLDIYFSMFLSILQEKESSPKSERQSIESRQAAKSSTNNNSTDTKINALTTNDGDVKEKIISGILSGINRAYPYSVAKDDFFEKRLDTLFKITHSSNFGTSIQALMLIQQLCSAHSAASDRFYRTLYESLLDPRLLTTSKHALYINLIYRSLKADANVKRVQAFVKRLGQIIAMHQPPFVCAVIYLIKDLEETFPALHALIDQPESYHDEELDVSVTDLSANLAYDGKKRDPQFSNADRCCIWEMHPLSSHFHPSVSLSVSKLLADQKIESKPDLSLHTLVNFLDRFVYRNPKKITDALKGVSLMQPMAIANASDMLISGRASGKRRGPALNTADFARMNNEKVQADEVFFHKYFSVKEHRKETAQKKKEKRRKSMALEDDAEEENEEEIWKALIDSRPELGDEEADSFEDDGFSDLESDGDDMMSDRPNEGSFPEDDGMGLEDDDALLDSDEALDLLDSDSEKSGVSDTAAQVGIGSGGRARKKRRLLKDLPTFASVEDYASMMQEDDERS